MNHAGNLSSSHVGTFPLRLTIPDVGLCENIPLYKAGSLNDPPTSDPNPMTEAALPNKAAWNQFKNLYYMVNKKQ